MKRYVFLVTKETLPLITKLNDGLELPESEIGNYFIAPAERMDEEFNDLMTKEDILAVFKNADSNALFQILS